MSRRTLLRSVAAGAGIAAAAGAGLAGLREAMPRLRRAASPPLPEAAPGLLSGHTAGVLLAAAAALLDTGDGDPPSERELRPYRRLFESRAQELPGYREVYRRFARAVEGEAAARGEASFAAAPPDLRRRVLDDLCPPGRLARLRLGLAEPDRVRFRLYVTREVLGRYAAAGAWTDLGYGEPPGVPRGLDAYTRPPAGAGGTVVGG